MVEKRTVTVAQLVNLEMALGRYEGITQARLGYGLGRNLTLVRRIMDDVRKRLEGTERLKEFNRRRMGLIQRPEGRTGEQLDQAIEALKDELGVRAELEDLAARERELLAEQEQIEWRPVSLAVEPGFGKDDALTAGVLAAGDRRLFLEVGIMYDPEDKPGE